MSLRMLILSGLASFASLSTLAQASVVLSPGLAPAALPGTTVAAEADLGGTVIEDKLIPFRIVSASGALLFEGKLQNRIVKSTSSGLLHFYYRIRDTTPGLNGIVKRVVTHSYAPSPRTLVDWRPDGLGMVNPLTAMRSAVPGATIRFDFNTMNDVLVGGRDSRFFYVKSMNTKYNDAGLTRIELVTGEGTLLKTFAPIN